MGTADALYVYAFATGKITDITAVRLAVFQAIKCETRAATLESAIKTVERVAKAEGKRYQAQQRTAWDRRVRRMLQSSASQAHVWTNAAN
eukprot:1215707-Karenia_brevis.AAC.1